MGKILDFSCFPLPSEVVQRVLQTPKGSHHFSLLWDRHPYTLCSGLFQIIIKSFWCHSHFPHFHPFRKLHNSSLFPISQLSTVPKTCSLCSVQFTVHHPESHQYLQIWLWMFPSSSCSKEPWIFSENSVFPMDHSMFAFFPLFPHTVAPGTSVLFMAHLQF